VPTIFTIWKEKDVVETGICRVTITDTLKGSIWMLKAENDVATFSGF
jgi:hypothetical protein